MLRQISPGSTLVVTETLFAEMIAGDYQQMPNSTVVVVPDSSTVAERLEALKQARGHSPGGPSSTNVPPGVPI